jgi:NhaC family Na+:H+ antiporter
MLLICVVTNISILVPLVLGFVIFYFYGIYKKYTPKEMLKMAFSGVATVRNILLIFILIGILTGTWRASGTIAYIVYYAIQICSPSAMVLISFILTSMVSFLTGTAFGAAATVGTICMAISNSLGIAPIWIGGAILSGCYFGDRCSPMSTSALLVCELTKTNIYKNMKRMAVTSLVPFIAASLIYLTSGTAGTSGEVDAAIAEIFRLSFNFHSITVAPAAVILVMSLFRIDVKKTMAVSIITAALSALFVQGISLPELLKVAALGYHPDNQTLSDMISGGGVLSMARVFCIVCLSSCFSGMFKGTGFLDGIKAVIEKASQRLTPYGGTFITAVLTSMIACNQTLSIMLTYQLCEDLERDEQKMAIHLENTAVLIAPLIPWSIASTVPLSSAGAPISSILAACYLYLVPLWNLVVEALIHKPTTISSVHKGL